MRARRISQAAHRMMLRKLRFAACVLAMFILQLPALAKVQPFPAGFRTQDIETIGATIHTRIGGEGPAVVLLHGFADTGDMWAPLAAELSRDHTVIVPDLRGMGLSSHPKTGYEKKAQAHDIAGVLDALKIGKADLVTHHIGNMVGYAFAAQYPDRVTRWVAMDAPLPGIGPWDEILKKPLLWHFNFRGPDAERLVAGREASTSTASITSCRPTRRASTRRRASTTPSFTRGRARCIRHSTSSRHLRRTRWTTRNSSPGASSRCRCWPSGRKSPSARRWRTICASLQATSTAP
jgi:pimeloyl-ACP methyl ester carboxylesterase